MKRNFLLWLLFIASYSIISAQQIDFNDYKVLRSSGTLPEEFSESVYKPVSKKQTSSKKKKKKKKQKDDESEFISETANSLNSFLRSGALVFNDPVSAYLNKVMTEVLRANNVDEQIRVVLLRSSDANAYAINENMIFVTTGLLAQLTSEAQLAFILAHEFVHYRDKHVFESYKKSKTIERDYRRYRKISSDEKKLTLFRHSREKELDADLGGAELYLRTAYSIKSIDEAYDVLKYSDFPFEEIAFEKAFLETEYLVFPPNYFLEEIAPIEVEENEDDEESTHPNLARRKSEMSAFLGGKQDQGRSEFIVSKDEFLTMRKISRYELCRLHLLEREYEKALYSAYVLLKEDSSSKYLKKIVAKSLYGLATYTNAKKLSRVHDKPKKVMGNQQQVNNLIEEIGKEDLTLTALNYTWRAHRQFPEDMELSKLADELFSQVVNVHSLNRYSLKNAPRDTSQTKTTDTDTVKNKYSRIKTKSKKKDDALEFGRYGFVDLLQDDEFVKRFNEHWDKRDENATEVDGEEKEEEKTTSSTGKKKKRPTYEAEKRDLDEPIDKIVYFEPFSYKIDLRKKKEDMLVASEEKKERFIYNLRYLSEEANVDSEVLKRNEIGSEDVDLYNEVCLITNFFEERYEHDDKIAIIPTDYQELAGFAEAHGSPYVSMPGSILFVEPRPAVATFLNVYLGLFLWPYLPYAIYKAATPRYTTLLYFPVFNVQTGKLSFSDVVEIRAKDGSGFVNSQIFDILLRMKSQNPE